MPKIKRPRSEFPADQSSLPQDRYQTPNYFNATIMWQPNGTLKITGRILDETRDGKKRPYQFEGYRLRDGKIPMPTITAGDPNNIRDFSDRYDGPTIREITGLPIRARPELKGRVKIIIKNITLEYLDDMAFLELAFNSSSAIGQISTHGGRPVETRRFGDWLITRQQSAVAVFYSGKYAKAL